MFVIKATSIELLIGYGLTILLVAVFFDKNDAVNTIAELLKILISGYLGYLVKTTEN